MRDRAVPRLAPLLALGTLLLLFVWIYGRFAPALHFVLDDPIETEVALARPWLAAVSGSFTGAINWSGYRPLTYAMRATLAHLFGTQQMVGYYVVSLGLHLLNTLLTWHIVRRVARNDAWAFLAGAIVLLLPSHNEAVLYMSASANLLALFFCLLTIEFALTARAKSTLWPQIAAAFTLGLAALAYEVTLPLILLVAAADWGMDRAAAGHTLRRRLPMYSAMAVAVVLVLAMRLLAGNGQVTPDRADYALTLDPVRIAQGYVILLGQMALLHTSPWPHVPLYANVRDWMAASNPRALASIILALCLSAATLIVGLRAARTSTSPSDRTPRPTFWMAWGLLWIVLMSLPFAALAGRHPENRYTYIPSFGMAVALSALAAWLQARGRARPIVQGLVVAAAVTLLTFYAYVDTSDVSEWERASAHARSFLSGASTVLPEPPAGMTVAQVGVPGFVGSAYVFGTPEGFGAAMRLNYAAPIHGTVLGDMALRTYLEADPAVADKTVLLGYSAQSHTVHPVNHALICATPNSCTEFRFSQASVAAPAWTYVSVGDPGVPLVGAVSFLIEPGAAEPAACGQVFDLTTVPAELRNSSGAGVAERCATTVAALRASGALEPVQ